MDRVFEEGASSTPMVMPTTLQTGYVRTTPTFTKAGTYWYHMVTEELCNALAAMGLTLDRSQTNQLAQGLTNIASQIAALQTLETSGVIAMYNQSWVDAGFGYPKGAVLLKAGGVGLWVSLVANNRVSPDAGDSASLTNWCDLDALTTATTSASTYTMTSTTTTYAVTIPMSLVTYYDGLKIKVKLPATNNGDSYIRVNNINTYKIIYPGGASLTGLELIKNNIVTLEWNSTYGAWVYAAPGVFNYATVYYKNLLLNGDFRFDQRHEGAAVSVPAAASFPGATYTLDRMVVWPVGAAITCQRIASGAGYAMQLTGATGCSQLVVGQRVAAINVARAANKYVTLSVTLTASAATTVTVQYRVPTAIDDYTNSTGTNLVTFAVTTTPTRFYTTFVLPSTVTNGCTFNLMVASGFTSGTLTIQDWQVELGNVPTPMEYVPYGVAKQQMMEYYEKSVHGIAPGSVVTTNHLTYFEVGYVSGIGLINSTVSFPFKASKRNIPTLTMYSQSGQAGYANWSGTNGGGTLTFPAANNTIQTTNNHFSLSTNALLTAAGRSLVYFYYAAESEI
jgi:hypothetical protein